MKKVLTTALALGLVAGVASTAAAAYDSFSVSGYYKVQGVYGTSMNNSTGIDLTTSKAVADDDSAWWMHTFRMKPVMQVNDKIKMVSEVRLANDNIWGTQDDDVAYTHRGVQIAKLYMEYMSPVGKIRLGRTPSGAWEHDFANTGDNDNRIMWWPNFMPANMPMLIFTEKTTERDSYIHNGIAATATSYVANAAGADQDSDYYEIDLGYKADNFRMNFGYGYSNAANTTDADMSRLKGYGKYTMDNLFVEAEFDKLFGSKTTTVDHDALAFMLNVGGSFGALDASLMYWHLSGQDANNTADDEAYDSSGEDFEPLLVMTGSLTGILNPDRGVSNGDDGVHAFALSSSFKVSDKTTVTAALGTAWADEEATGQDDEYGWEIDLGVAYKLLDNLTYSLNFGYMDAGDYWKGVNNANTLHEDDVTLAIQTLNMTF